MESGRAAERVSSSIHAERLFSLARAYHDHENGRATGGKVFAYAATGDCVMGRSVPMGPSEVPGLVRRNVKILGLKAAFPGNPFAVCQPAGIVVPRVGTKGEF